MSEHACRQLSAGCYRCDLNVDELRTSLADSSTELMGIRVAIELLTDRADELLDEIRAGQLQVDRWDMGLVVKEKP